MSLATISNDLKRYKRVVVEISEAYLSQTSTIATFLQNSCPETLFYFSSDSSFPDCCVDYITSMHVDCNAILKIGMLCTKPYGLDIPVIHAYPDTVSRDLSNAIQSLGESCCMRYLVIPAHVSALYGSILPTENSTIVESWIELEDLAIGEGSTIVLVEQPSWIARLAPLVATKASCISVINSNTESLDFATMRFRSQRWALLQKLFGVSSFALVIQSSDPSIVELASLVEKTLLKRGSACYVLNVGRITTEKLGNYPDIGAFVVLGCPRVSILSENVLFPVLSCYELFCLLEICDFWYDSYKFSTKGLLELVRSLGACDDDVLGKELSIVNDHSVVLFKTHTFQGLAFEPPTFCSESPKIEPGLFGLPERYEEHDTSKMTFSKGTVI